MIFRVWASLVAQMVKRLPAMWETQVRSPGGADGNPLQYSYLENPTDRKAWWAIVYKVTKSGTQLKRHNALTPFQGCL